MQSNNYHFIMILRSLPRQLNKVNDAYIFPELTFPFSTLFSQQRYSSLFLCLGSVLNLDLRKLRSYGPLVNIRGEGFSKHEKMALSCSWSSLTFGSGPKNACGGLGHGIITWDF